MAITRSQIARQLLAEGGAPRSPGNTTLQRVLPRMDGQRPGFYGPDMGEGGAESSFGQDTYSTSSVDFGGESGGSDAQFQATAEALGTPQTPGRLDNFRADSLRKQLDYMYGNTNLFGLANPFKGPALDIYDKDFLGAGQKDKDVVGLDQYGMSGKDLTRSQNIQGALDEFQTTGRLSQKTFNEVFGSNITKTPSDNEVMIRKPMIPQLPTDIEPEKSDYEEFVQRFTLPERFRLAEGGEPRQAYGLGKLVKKVTGAVKKVAKSDLGKAALIGTAAFGLPGTEFGGLFGRKAFGGAAQGIFGSAGIADFFSKQALFADKAGDIVYGDSPFTKALNFMKTPKGALATIGGLTAAAFVLTPKQKQEVDSLSSRIADRTGLDIEGIRKEVQQAYASGNTEALRTKYPFLPPETAVAADGGRIGFDEGGKDLSSDPNYKGWVKIYETDPELAEMNENHSQYLKFYNSQKKAVGGIINEEDEMLDMGGNEMDLRGGGFVPIGEYEKKDDVPARLSKNEFVFTADAVRAAGGGSVDRGADLMYKTMKQLENKVV